MRWPEPGTAPTCSVADIPVGSRVDGLAPIGVRWSATRTAKGFRPDDNCPASEFLPCFVELDDVIKEVV